MMASLKSAARATFISASSRRLFVLVLFQETMKPSMPADFAWSICFFMIDVSSLEYRPANGWSVLARSQDLGVNHW